jgi:orotidine-5'-phosphate decarboxylase
MSDWNDNNNCALVMGSPYPRELAMTRKILGDDALFLIPGVGTQGGSIADTVKAGVNKAGVGVMINSSREILYSSNGDDFATTAREKAVMLRDEINKYR